MSTIHHLSEHRSIVDQYMLQLRDVNLQQGRAAFRQNIRNIGRVIGYEVSKTLQFVPRTIQTPLQEHSQHSLQDEVVIITILRAGLPLHEGILDVLPEADSGFISAYRKHEADGSFHIEVEYVACPKLDGKVLILNDPMLATGQSFINAMHALEAYGKPKVVHLAAVIASRQGVEYIKDHDEWNFDLWVAAIDPDLNADKYIVPGLGDAGDLAFGPKLQY